MRAVAATTVHFPFVEGMCIRLPGLSVLLLMALKTDLRLTGGVDNRIAGNVNLMAVGAGNFIIVVAAAMPGQSDALAVAAETHVILYANFSFRVCGETDYGRALLSATHPAGVRTAGPVTGFALQLSAAKWARRIRRHAMAGFEYRHRRRIVMAGDARVGTIAAIRGFGIGRGLRECRG